MVGIVVDFSMDMDVRMLGLEKIENKLFEFDRFGRFFSDRILNFFSDRIVLSPSSNEVRAESPANESRKIFRPQQDESGPAAVLSL